jgi:branched-chain amino acid transport system substrate-binding protein
MKKLLKVICLSLLLFSFTSLACAQDEIRIGVLFPLTGPLASTGQGLLEGAKLAADIVNTKNNLNMPLAKTFPGIIKGNPKSAWRKRSG